jgi:hypothetical protein
MGLGSRIQGQKGTGSRHWIKHCLLASSFVAVLFATLLPRSQFLGAMRVRTHLARFRAFGLSALSRSMAILWYMSKSFRYLKQQMLFTQFANVFI